MWGKKQQLEPCMEKKDWLKIKKGVQQGCLLWAWLFNLYTEHIMRNARLDELQAGIKIGERNINNLRYTDDTTLMAESKEELKSLLMSVKEESERASLRLNIKKKPHKIMYVKSEDNCFFGWKAMTNLDNVLKIRDITLPAKVHIVFPVIM